MPKLLVLAALSLAPLTAFADDTDDTLPVTAADDTPSAADDAQPVTADTQSVTDAPISAPGTVEPVAAPAPETDHYSCAHGWYQHGRRRGFLGIGFAKGHLDLDNDTEGRQKSLIIRAQGRRGFGLELEFARARLGAGGIEGDLHDTARTTGVSVYKAFGRRRLMPYVLAGGGRGTIDRATGGDDHMRYAEFGGGLMLKLRHFAIGVDVRRGVRRIDDHDIVAPAMTAPAVVMPTGDDERARYVRGRVMALLTF